MYLMFSIEWHINWRNNIIVMHMDIDSEITVLNFILAKQLHMLKNQ